MKFIRVYLESSGYRYEEYGESNDREKLQEPQCESTKADQKFMACFASKKRRKVREKADLENMNFLQMELIGIIKKKVEQEPSRTQFWVTVAKIGLYEGFRFELNGTLVVVEQVDQAWLMGEEMGF